MPKLTEDAKRNIIWWQKSAQHAYINAQECRRFIGPLAESEWRLWMDAQARRHRNAAEAMRQTGFDIDDEASHERLMIGLAMLAGFKAVRA